MPFVSVYRLSSFVLACAVLFGGCSQSNDTRADIVFVVLDTVRADHCSDWGYGHNTTPHLDAFLEIATQYRYAQSTSSWTLPSHASMFTGLQPFEHGAHVFGFIDKSGQLQVHEPPLAEEHVTLAERLREAGYATGAFCANLAYLAPRNNLQQGFDTWYNPDHPGEPGKNIVEGALEWYGKHGDKPRFLFVNLIDAHRPYNLGEVDSLYGEDVSTDATLLDTFREQVMGGNQDFDLTLAKQVIRQYDTGIANADMALGRLLNELKENDQFNNALIIVTSDHGESLGEHRFVEHSKDVYEEVMWVPLAVKLPGQTLSHVVESRVTIGQLYATIMDVVGLTPNEKAMNALPVPSTSQYDEPVFGELYYTRKWDLDDPRWGHRFRRVRTVLYQADWKFIHSTDQQHELYKLSDDPKEQKNLFNSESAKAEAMMEWLRSYRSLDVKPEEEGFNPVPLTEEEEEKLRTLGYL